MRGGPSQLTSLKRSLINDSRVMQEALMKSNYLKYEPPNAAAPSYYYS